MSKNKLYVAKYSLHAFNNREDIKFSLNDYSKLKYGSGSVAKKMGEELAQAFFDKYSHTLTSKQIVVMESAYASIKNAASLITDSFTNTLNMLMSELNGMHIERTKINRIIPYIADYGKVSLAKRKQLLKKDTFTLDVDFVKNKFLIFLDDVLITGTHQRKLEEMMDKYQLPYDSAICVYYAELNNHMEDPAIESYLNSYFIKGLGDLGKLMRSDLDYSIVVRTVKTILQERDTNVTETFINALDYKLLAEIYHACLGEGYYKNPAFSTNFAILRDKFLTTGK